MWREGGCRRESQEQVQMHEGVKPNNHACRVNSVASLGNDVGGQDMEPLSHSALPEDELPIQVFSQPPFLPTPPKQGVPPGSSAQTCVLMSRMRVCACVKMSQQVGQAEVSR